jgi:hypothetical protein
MKIRIAVWLTIAFACSMVMPAAEKVPLRPIVPLALSGAAPPQPNGDFVISVERRGHWQEIGRLGEDRFLREQRLDLAPWLQGDCRARVRIRQAGGGASHLDAVLLGGRAPLAARGGPLSKLRRRDNDLVNAGGRGVDLTFAAGSDRVLSLAGRIESTVIGTEPLQFPAVNTFKTPSASSSFYSYRLGSAAPPKPRFASRAWLDEVGRRQPLFEVLSPTGSGHPTGYTYGWVSNDARNLYVTIDFTPDNTCDGGKDYAKVYARGNGRVREFKVSVPERRWGRAHFVYTDKAAYQHKVYDFAIPLCELPAAAGELDLCFAAYGTASAMTPEGVNLAYDPARNRYLLVYSVQNGSNTDVFGQFVAVDGRNIGAPFVIAGDAVDQESRPIVACDTVNHRFLVAWYRYMAESYVEARILDADGAPVAPMFQIVSNSFPISIFSTAVAFDDVNQRYLVVWAEGTMFSFPGNICVKGQLRDRNGDLIEVDGDAAFDISPDCDHGADDVAAAFDSQSELYMVVWQNQTAGGQAFSKAAIPDGTQVAAQMVDSSGGLSGAPFGVTSGDAFHGMPAVADDSVNHRFLVAWIEAEDVVIASRGRWQHRAERTAVDGFPYVPIACRLFDNLGAAVGGVHYVSTVPDRDHGYPRLAFDPGRSRFLAVFQSVEWFTDLAVRRRESALSAPYSGTVAGQFLNRNGSPILTSPATNFRIGTTSVPFFAPGVACETACGSFLAAWSLESDPNVARAVIGSGCVDLPRVVTLPVTDVTTTGATGGGNVTSDGGAAVTVRGVCWNTSGNPVLANAHTSDGSGTGLFTSALTGLLPATTYHVRAYATNSAGTFYGEEVTFTTARWAVTFLADAGGALSGKTPQYVADGGDCTPVEALVTPGFIFLRWEGSDASSTQANPLTVTDVHGNLTFTARYGTLALSAVRRVEHAWIIRAEYAEIEIAVGGLAESGAAKFLLMRREDGGAWTLQKEILPTEFTDGRYTFASLPLDKDKAYSFRVEARNAAGALIGASAEVTI